MNAKPIIFSGPMVRALLDGRKTQTRRVVKPQPNSGPDGEIVHLAGADFALKDGDLTGLWTCFYGQPGDLLWVRETWAPFDGHPLYKADGDPNFNDGKGLLKIDRWRPSIHMPRWASRLTLYLTDVRVERVQNIGLDDIATEGGPPLVDEMQCDAAHVRECKEWFASLWDSINAKRGYSWADNPWVWALTFRVIHANVDDVLAHPDRYLPEAA